jgi:predicted enzyme related to lactoylglutathione lyase
MDAASPHIGTWRKEEPMIPAGELRFILVTDDNEAAAHLYRDVFGLEVQMNLDEPAGKGVILNVPAATLEVVGVGHERMVDGLEAGRPLDHRVRVAVRVDDLAEAARAVTASGAEAMAAPVETPWGDHNQRFRTKDGMQLTLFETTVGDT